MRSSHVADTGAAVAGVVQREDMAVIGIILGLKSAAAAVMRNGRKGDGQHYSAYVGICCILDRVLLEKSSAFDRYVRCS